MLNLPSLNFAGDLTNLLLCSRPDRDVTCFKDRIICPEVMDSKVPRDKFEGSVCGVYLSGLIEKVSFKSNAYCLKNTLNFK